MPQTIYLIACVAEKRLGRHRARDIYCSPWFNKARAFAEHDAATWFILSAKHGLLDPSKWISPYELTLNCMAHAERLAWSMRLLHDLLARVAPGDTVVLLAGERYREHIVPVLQRMDLRVEEPLAGLRIGEQLAWLNRRLASPKREASRASIRALYAALDRRKEELGGFRYLRECDGRMPWPTRGVYVFFDEHESRAPFGRGPRVVRIGTHAISTGSKSTLWQRLSQHRGAARGGGNHRGSIFRLLVGEAMLVRDLGACPTWGHGQSAVRATREAENWLEEGVSEYIGALPFLWFELLDEPSKNSQRATIERAAIATLSSHQTLSIPRKGWLGQHSPRDLVRGSGLWNIRGVGDLVAGEDAAQLDRLS